MMISRFYTYETIRNYCRVDLLGFCSYQAGLCISGSGVWKHGIASATGGLCRGHGCGETLLGPLDEIFRLQERTRQQLACRFHKS